MYIASCFERRSSSASCSQCSQGIGDQLLNAPRVGANHLAELLLILERQKGRHGTDAVLLCDLGYGVDVNLGKEDAGELGVFREPVREKRRSVSRFWSSCKCEDSRVNLRVPSWRACYGPKRQRSSMSSREWVWLAQKPTFQIGERLPCRGRTMSRRSQRRQSCSPWRCS